MEVHGVKICLHCADHEGQEYYQKTGRNNGSHDVDTLSNDAQGGTSRDKQSYVHDPGGSTLRKGSRIAQKYHMGPGDDLPSTVDLARSFLHHEPKETREELQSTVADLRNVDKSSVSTIGDSEESTVGVADTLSLPTFLAGFLRGVGDRTQVKMKDVEINLKLTPSGSMENSTISNAAATHEDVTVRMVVEEITTDGLLSSNTEAETCARANESEEASIEARRRIVISKLGLTLISEASLFSNFAKPTRSPSSKSTHTSPVAKFRRSTPSSLVSTSSQTPSVRRPSPGPDRDASTNGARESGLLFPLANDSVVGTAQTLPDGTPIDQFPTATISSGSPSSSIMEDLAESKHFTHEEASMYMSALSHDSDEALQGLHIVPDEWNTLNSEREDPPDALHINQGSPSDRLCVCPYQQPLYNSKGDARDTPPLIGDKHNHTGLETSDPFWSEERRTSLAEPSTELVSSPAMENENISTAGISETSSTNIKSSFEVAKRIFAIDRISLIFPLSTAESVGVLKNRAQRQGNEQVSKPADNLQSSETSRAGSATQMSGYLANSPFPLSNRGYSVDIGSIQISSDMALSRLIISIIQQLTFSHGSASDKEESKKASTPVSQVIQEFRFSIAGVYWKFLDNVNGVPSMKGGESEQVDQGSSTENSEVLLRADVEKVNIAYRRSEPFSNVVVSVCNLSFGYCSDPIISFDANLKMRKSTRDILAPNDNDVLLIVKHYKGATDVNITTLPIHVALNLQRLDETFSWLGGFSSMLDLGNSMMSTMTVPERRPKDPASKKPFRGVRFEDSGAHRPMQHGNPPGQKKLTARFGGLVIELQGKHSALQIETTAMKLVSREEGLGLQVDRLNLNGPLVGNNHSLSEPSMRVKITNVRVEYLPSPKEVDLTRLLALLSPSKDKSAGDDDILLDTLLRQRAQGGVVRATIENLEGQVCSLDDLQYFSTLTDDLKKLSTVTKYLPEDDRPGILTLGLIKTLHVGLGLRGDLGRGTLACTRLELAHVSLPSLIAVSVTSLQVYRNEEELVGNSCLTEYDTNVHSPMVMARFIGNELEPIAKIRINGIRIEYHVSTIMAILGLDDTSTSGAMITDLVNSVVMATSHHLPENSPRKASKLTSPPSETSTPSNTTIGFDVAIKDSILGLNPRGIAAKGVLVLTDIHLFASLSGQERASASLNMRKATIMIIDDVNAISSHHGTKPESPNLRRSQIEYLSDMGYVVVGHISAAKASMKTIPIKDEVQEAIDVEIKEALLILETCADSAHTLQEILNRLKPPVPPSNDLRYRTEVVPVEDMLASLTGDAFVAKEGEIIERDHLLESDEGDMVEDDLPQNLEFVSSFYNPEPNAAYNDVADSMLEGNLESLASPPMTREIGGRNIVQSFHNQTRIASGDASLDFQEDHFGVTSAIEGPWDGNSNAYNLGNEAKFRGSSLRLRMRDVHIIWNLFDGYDWQSTRNVLNQAVDNVQRKAYERLSRRDRRRPLDLENEDESAIGDFLFNSIYIGIPPNRDPKQLASQVNRNIDDFASEAESHSTTTLSVSPGRQHPPGPRGRKLRLKRSHYHKMTFELKGISADLIVFPPGSGETETLIDIRIQDLEIYDHVPTSTWKKFATYMHDAGERENGTSMIHLEILNVRPVPNLAASEMILKVCWLLSA